MSSVSLFSQDDLSASTKVLTGLRGAFVGSSLKTDHALASSQLFFGELTTVLGRWCWSEIWAFKLWVFVAL
jgi:hypothetical protein